MKIKSAPTHCQHRRPEIIFLYLSFTYEKAVSWSAWWKMLCCIKGLIIKYDPMLRVTEDHIGIYNFIKCNATSYCLMFVSSILKSQSLYDNPLNQICYRLNLHTLNIKSKFNKSKCTYSTLVQILCVPIVCLFVYWLKHLQENITKRISKT